MRRPFAHSPGLRLLGVKTPELTRARSPPPSFSFQPRSRCDSARGNSMQRPGGGLGGVPVHSPLHHLLAAYGGGNMKKHSNNSSINGQSKSPNISIEKILLKSKAWHSLTGISCQVYTDFLLRRKFDKRGAKGQEKWFCWNSQELIFTYREAEIDLGITPRRFTTAIDQLTKVGFIDIVKVGIPAARVPTTYGISERWRKFGQKDFTERARFKGLHVGFCR